MTPKIEPTQEDRDAAAIILDAYESPNYATILRTGNTHADGLLVPQVLARHAQAAEARGRAEGYEQAIREGVKRLEQEFAVRSSKVGGIMSGGGRDYDIGRATGYAHAAAILKLLENRE